jgi:NAD(P)-dependent dehydrogenase (short-subunit alcohol dehydrogenase family)
MVALGPDAFNGGMAKKTGKKRPLRPPQTQSRQPGIESKMRPRPVAEDSRNQRADKLGGKVALITGGDSGIGRAVAILFAAAGADVAIVYLDEHRDARETGDRVEAHGRRFLAIPGDAGDPAFCRTAVRRVLRELDGLDVLVNNAAEQHPAEDLTDITPRQLERTFRTNIFSYFYMTQAALPHLRPGSSIVNTTSVTAYRGSPQLIDYAATKGAIVAFTRSLAMSLVERGIRVNGVAPGPIWTPLIPATNPSAKEVAEFGSDVPMARSGEPEEVAPAFLFLASDDASYMTGQVLHPNGGEIING